MKQLALYVRLISLALLVIGLAGSPAWAETETSGEDREIEQGAPYVQDRTGIDPGAIDYMLEDLQDEESIEGQQALEEGQEEPQE